MSGAQVRRGQRRMQAVAGDGRRSPKEVYITPTSIKFGTQHPLNFKLAHLTPP
jgi:hypothetical protein